MDIEEIEGTLKKLIDSLDKGIRLETILEEENEFRAILSKGTHSARAILSKERMKDFLKSGKGAHEVKKALGKVVSKLNRLAQKRG